MGSASTPPPPPPTPPPVRVTGPDRAKQADDQKQRERKRYDFSDTIIAGSGRQGLADQAGLKSTLG